MQHVKEDLASLHIVLSVGLLDVKKTLLATPGAHGYFVAILYINVDRRFLFWVPFLHTRLTGSMINFGATCCYKRIMILYLRPSLACSAIPPSK